MGKEHIFQDEMRSAESLYIVVLIAFDLDLLLFAHALLMPQVFALFGDAAYAF